MASSQNEMNVSFHNTVVDQRDQNDLVRNVQVENPTNAELEDTFKNPDSVMLAKVKNIPFIIAEKYGNKKFIVNNWFNTLLLLALFLLFILSCMTIGVSFFGLEKQQGQSVKCKICGKGIQFHTILGDLVANACTNDTSEISDYECGPESACMTMNVTQSDRMRNFISHMKEYAKNNSEFILSDPLTLHEGILKGCVSGFIWDQKCHFFNDSLFGLPRSRAFWTSTNTCICTTDNCN